MNLDKLLKLEEIVEKIMNNDDNLSKVKINPEHGRIIADAYEAMEYNPNHPDVKPQQLDQESLSPAHKMLGLSKDGGKKQLEKPKKQQKEFNAEDFLAASEKTYMGLGSALKKAAIDLAKGSLQRKTPFNPKSQELPEELANWIYGSGSPEDRKKIPRIEGNARARALHKLSGMTDVKIDENGKRHYLLHRGVGPTEYKKYVDEESKQTKHHTSPDLQMSSWTPDHSVAYNFSNDPSGNHVISAYISEDDIHSIPMQTGVKFKGKHQPLSSRLKREKEVIVNHTKPHKLLDKETAFKLSLPHSSYEALRGDTVRDVQGSDGYYDKIDVSNVNQKINEKAKAKSGGLDIKYNKLTANEKQKPNLKKTLTAGIPSGAPSTLTGGEALQKESLTADLQKPFSSKAQRRFAYANPEKFGGKKGIEEWESKTPKNIPERVKKSKKQKTLKDMKKGERGDWKKEGYTFTHKQDIDERFTPDYISHTVYAHDKDGNLAGKYFFSEKIEGKKGNPQLPDFYASALLTHKDHRRKGLASAAHDFIESKVGKKVETSPILSGEGRKFYANREKINKSEQIQKAKKKKNHTPQGIIKNEKEIEAENLKIKENKKKLKATKKHKFKAAKYTHPNGHPRCIICGNEETIDGICRSSLEKTDILEESKPNLQKMSRGLPEFKNFPKVTSRPDQEIQNIDTERQAKMFGRKAAANSVFSERDPYNTLIKEKFYQAARPFDEKTINENISAAKAKFDYDMPKEQFTHIGLVGQGDLIKKPVGMVAGEGNYPTGARRQHEAIHLLLDDLGKKYGYKISNHAQDRINQLIHPDIRDHLAIHMSKVGYSPEAHHSEYAPHLYEMLHDPKTRDLMRKTNPEFANKEKELMGHAKKSWKAILDFAKNLKNIK
jgi:GNAT superfamily N-acetyltransferase